MPTRRNLIQSIDLNAPSNSVVFEDIPQNYSTLVVYFSNRNNDSTPGYGFDNISVSFNASITGYKTRVFRSMVGSINNYGADTSYIGDSTNATATSNTYGYVKIVVPGYSSSRPKLAQVVFFAENNSTTLHSQGLSALSWNNTSPVTSLKIQAPGTDTFVAGSSVYLYGITHVPIINGGEVSIRDGFKYHTFRSTSTLQVVEPGDVEYLVVAGGGGGGANSGGGGGAGGLLSGKTRLNAGIFSATVGAGGNAGIQGGTEATQGSTSSISSISATGGGRGARGSTGAPEQIGGTGGSGGGGAQGGGTTGAGGTGTSGQGSNGGSGSSTNNPRAGGGGGGKTSAGSAGNPGVGGNGGTGLQWPPSSGTYYGGGGGGGIRDDGTTAGSGGLGGGGSASSAGVANTGGGGGSGIGSLANGNNGGSGIVVIRYPYDGN